VREIAVTSCINSPVPSCVRLKPHASRNSSHPSAGATFSQKTLLFFRIFRYFSSSGCSMMLSRYLNIETTAFFWAASDWALQPTLMCQDNFSTEDKICCFFESRNSIRPNWILTKKEKNVEVSLTSTFAKHLEPFKLDVDQCTFSETKMLNCFHRRLAMNHNTLHSRMMTEDGIEVVSCNYN